MPHDDTDGGVPSPKPLRPFVDPRDLTRRAARRLIPPRRVTIAETALEHRRLRNPGGGYTGPWKHDEVPYLVEPMQAQTSRTIGAVIFVAPAQTGKTEGMLVNPVVHAVIVDPADMLIIQTTDYMARDFSRRRLRRLIEDHPSIRGRLHEGKGSDNLLDKSFDGMLLSIGHPTINQLSGRPLPRIYLTDYDRMPQDIDGEGNAFDLSRKRTQTFGSRGLAVAESSPGHPVTKAKWKSNGPHEAPPAPGILALYNRGDRRRWHWKCPSCDGYFEGRFSQFRWDDHTDPAAAAATVELVCPVNGCRIPPAAKFQMNQTGIWVPEGMEIAAGGVLTGERRRTDIASYWLFGPAAAFQAWPQMVQRFLEAEAEFEQSQDDSALKTTINTDQGEAYIPRSLIGESSLDADELADRVEVGLWQRVPVWARFLTAAIDVQASPARFEVLVRAWGAGLESAVIDKFDIWQNAEEERPLDPGKYAADWDLLEDAVLTKAYPIEGDEGHELGIHRVVIDSGGAAGVTTESYDFLRRVARRDRKRQGARLARRIILSKGTGRADAPRVAKSFPDSRRKDRKAAGRGEIPVWIFATNRLKDEIYNHLGRDPGPKYIHFPTELREAEPPHEFFEQVCAESRQPDGKYTKDRPRNEALDLLVMSYVGALQSQAERLNWEKPPAWARLTAANPLYRPIAPAEPAPEEAPVTLEDLGKPAGRRRRRRAARRPSYVHGGPY